MLGSTHSRQLNDLLPLWTIKIRLLAVFHIEPIKDGVYHDKVSRNDKKLRSMMTGKQKVKVAFKFYLYKKADIMSAVSWMLCKNSEFLIYI
jgi:hypothetical protein